MQLYMRTSDLVAKYTANIGGSRKAITEYRKHVKQLAARFKRLGDTDSPVCLIRYQSNEYGLECNDEDMIDAAQIAGFEFLPVIIKIEQELNL